MAYPKIIYGSPPAELVFSFPPVSKPGTDPLHGERTDQLTMSDILGSTCERIETLRALQVEFVPASDGAAWATFMAFALEGNPFDYFPDADVDSSSEWTVQDSDWKPQYNFRGIGKFTLKLRGTTVLVP